MKRKWFRILLLVVLLSACKQPTVSVPTEPARENIALGLSFPPIANGEQRAFTEEQLEALDVRMIRFAVDW